MVKKLLCISATLLAFACSPQKKASESPAAAAADGEADASTAGMEYCSDEVATNCFLEARVDGRSEFYTTKDQEAYWLTRDGLATLGVKFTALSADDYAKKITSDVYPRATYDKSVSLNMDAVDQDGNARLPKRPAGLKVPNLQVGKFFSDIGKKFKRRPGMTSGKGARIGFKAIFGTFGAAALLPLVQSIWDTFSPDKNGRLVKPSAIDVNMNFQGETISDVISE